MIVHTIPGVRRADSQGAVDDSFETGRLAAGVERDVGGGPAAGSAVRPARL